MGAKWFGARVLRKEDPALLTGQGRYVDDIKLPGMLHAVVLRSPLPMPQSAASTKPERSICRASTPS